MINGAFDASCGVFLIFKILSDYDIDAKSLFYYYTYGTCIIWIKSLFFAPLKTVRNSECDFYSTLQESPFGSICRTNDVALKNIETPLMKNENNEEKSSAKKSITSVKYLSFLAYLTVMTTR